jgi:hypothetical protein
LVFAPTRTVTDIGCRHGAAVSSTVRVNSCCTGPSGAQHGQRHQVLGEQFLLAAEPAADPRGEHPDLLAV